MMTLQKAFGKLFPLCPVAQLPRKAEDIERFLKKRIPLEVEESTLHMVRQVSKVLCEISPPKSYLVDMARIVTDKAKEAERHEETIKGLRDAIEKWRDTLRVANEEKRKLAAELKEATDRIATRE
jgi:rRNA maturation endonuclease Nob1